uniref:TAF1C beta-propeller domain-containing protein n=1 Tax=Xenopus tropicalis TaxID=8364 RepID=A0A1B8XV44_XENTR|eukprot:XP_004920489.1 PREDICTED: TATA box-binding protein-associated factor RNA polymerase I subunit C [Xenopus tropicalis]
MEFPGSLFPSFYSEGPCAREAPTPHSVFGLGEHSKVQHSNSAQDGYKFIPLYSRSAERWSPTSPAPIPLLPPNPGSGIPPVLVSDIVQEMRAAVPLRNTLVRKSSVQLDFTNQLGNFSLDHSDTAFQCMGQLLEPHCYLGDKQLYRKVRETTKKMTGMLQSLRHAMHRDCPYSYSDSQLRCLSFLACDWLQDIPPVMLGQCVHEGLAEQWSQLQYSTQNTGGALSYSAYSEGHYGCLIFPHGEAMNELHFQQVKLNGGGHRVKLLEDPAVFELNGRIQQVASAKGGSSEEVLVGVRSNYHLASWAFSSQDPPRALRVVDTQSPSTCINVR